MPEKFRERWETIESHAFIVVTAARDDMAANQLVFSLREAKAINELDVNATRRQVEGQLEWKGAAYYEQSVVQVGKTCFQQHNCPALE